MRAVADSTFGQVVVMERDQAVLQYNYDTVQPPDGFLEKVRDNSKKYAQPRSDYIHPLYGLEGEVLTDDWVADHPHHRGIYWAWPEVDYQGQRGDLHALQLVFARPTGNIQLESGEDCARIEAENLWKWEDRDPIVRELTTIRVHRARPHGRFIDLAFRFTALKDRVSIARRDTDKYGGLNIRLSAVKDLQIILHTDPEHATPRRAWADAIGVRPGGPGSSGFCVFQHATNPQSPGQWIEYPNLPWFQPTFPTAGTRYELKKDKPLDLRFRLWLRRGGSLSASQYIQRWDAYQAELDAP